MYNFKKGKDVERNYQVNLFSTKIRDTCNEIPYSLNSQNNKLSSGAKGMLL